MNSAPLPRRTFLLDAARLAAAGFLAADLQLLIGCARDDGARDGAFANLSAAESRAMRAFAAQIIPAEDGLPGAEAAGVVHFVDRAFGMPFYFDKAAVIRSGLAELDARARSAKHGEFAAASSEEQIAMMREIEATEFFVAARSLVVIGMFADPMYGGNRGEAGWTLIGLEHRPTFAAPYGWYDAHVAPDTASGHA